MMATDEEDRGDKNGATPDWKDPDIPAGNSPPLPAWPLLVSAALWCGWVVVMVVTAITR
jgi:hypothetical protein